MQVKTNVQAGKAGICPPWECGSNHSEAQVRAAARGLKVRTGVKAGATRSPIPSGGSPG